MLRLIFLTALIVLQAGEKHFVICRKDDDSMRRSWFHPSRTVKEEQSAISTVEQFISEKRQILERDLTRTKQELDEAQRDLYHRFSESALHGKRRLVRSVRKNIFRQRVGFDRLVHSVRAHVGFFLGITVAMAGYTNPFFREGGALALQASQISWDASLLMNLPFDPWVSDLLATVVGVSSWKTLPTEASMYIPRAFLMGTLFRTYQNLLEDAFFEEKKGVIIFFSVVSALGSFALLSSQEIPIELAASAISGARIMFDSLMWEVEGNWLYMIEVGLPLVTGAFWAVLALLWTPFKLLLRFLRFTYNKSQQVPLLKKMITMTIKLYFDAQKTVKRIKEPLLEFKAVKTFQGVWERIKHSYKANRMVVFPWAVAVVGMFRQLGRLRSVTEAFRIMKVVMNPLSQVGKYVRTNWLHLTGRTVRHIDRKRRNEKEE